MRIEGIQTGCQMTGERGLGSMDAGDGIVTPEIRHLPADMLSGVWLRNEEIEVTKGPVLE